MKRLVWICIVLFAASSAVAQSLAEVAKKEKERRKQLESSESRTITDTELRRAGGPRTLLPASRTSADDDADATGEDAGEDEEPVTDERQTEAYWRSRLEPIDSRIKTFEERLNSPQLTMNPVGAPERARVEQQLADARAERQAVIDEARRKGVPPGWLR